MNTFRFRAHSAAFACLLLMPFAAAAQDAFPDTPQNHWAFDALTRLKKDGLLVGYPDGMFRGGRPTSRYEMAAAINAAYLALKNSTDSLAAETEKLNEKLSQGSEVTKADLQPIQGSLQSLTSQLNAMKGYGDDIESLKKLFTAFQRELETMGVDVKDAQRSLGDLTARVDALEKRKLPIDIKGQLDFVGLGGFSQGGEFGVTLDGRPTGIGRGSYGSTLDDLDGAAHVGLTRDLTMMHELALTLTDNKPDPMWHFVVVTGNMIGDRVAAPTLQPAIPAPYATGFGNQSSTFAGVPFMEAPQSFYIQNASAKFEGHFHGEPYRIEMGRFDHRVSPYVFQRPDTTPYFSNERWDNGQWSVDGAVIKWGEGQKAFSFFLGRPAVAGTTGGAAIQPMTALSNTSFCVGQNMPVGVMGGTAMTVNEVMGADLHLPFLKTGQANVSYVMMRSDSTVGLNFGENSANGVNVFGASLRGTLAGVFPINASWTKSNVVYNSTGLISRDNVATDIGISHVKGKLGFKAGFRAIGPNFGSAGDWGRIGMWWNPTNVNDSYFRPQIGLGGWTLAATTHYVIGQGKPGEGPEVTDGVIPFSKNDHDLNLGFTLSHAVGSGLQALVGVESADWHFAGSEENGPATNIRQRWYDFGITCVKGETTFNVLLQLSDYKDNGLSGFQPFGFNSNQDSAHGGLLTTQITTRF